jgi:hypothetical protein
MPGIDILGIQSTDEDLPKRASFWRSLPSDVVCIWQGPGHIFYFGM